MELSCNCGSLAPFGALMTYEGKDKKGVDGSRTEGNIIEWPCLHKAVHWHRLLFS